MSDVSSEVDNPLNDSFIQRWSVMLAVACFIVAAGAYALKFSEWLNFSDSTETWGQLGDYLGGVINPIVGLITIWLITTSLRQNQIALRQTREELAETRRAIDQAAELQEKTEEALSKQVTVAQQARDMNNTIAMYNHLRVQEERLTKDVNGPAIYDKGEDLRPVRRVELHKTTEELGFLRGIMDVELARLIKESKKRN